MPSLNRSPQPPRDQEPSLSADQPIANSLERHHEPPFLSRVVLHNYKNISYCDVSLGNLTFLVGPNGSGKSNFLESLQFVKDAVRFDLETTLTSRNGLPSVLSNSAGSGASIGMRLDFSLPSSRLGHYAFLLNPTPGGGHKVLREECFVYGPNSDHLPAYFKILEGTVDTNVATLTGSEAVGQAELALSHSGHFGDPINQVGRAIMGMNFYNIVPDAFRKPTNMPSLSKILAENGGNLPAVLQRLATQRSESTQRIEEYLTRIVPTVGSVRARLVGGMQLLEFFSAETSIQALDASLMSAGTLRVLGILTALFQAPEEPNEQFTVVGIEEPEAAVHPGAAGVLLDALREASETIQVLVTSHSPELLDDKRLAPSSIISFDVDQGSTRIGMLDEVGASSIRDRLVTAGELLRVNQVYPNVSVVQSPVDSLFGK